MSTNAVTESVFYPESDGLPMADNTVQYRWITKLVGGLQTMFRDDPNTFVAGDLFWYPVEGNNTIVVAPDALVAMGRPQGDRGSYRQWEEGGVAPQVVFEVLSPGNRGREMKEKLEFYDRYGVEEYYVIDPDTEPETLKGWKRDGDSLVSIDQMEGWVSPQLRIRFETVDSALNVFGPDGWAFEDYVEVAERALRERRRARKSARLARSERQRAEMSAELARSERQRAEMSAELARSERQRAEMSAELARSERQRADEAARSALVDRQRAEQAMQDVAQAMQDVEQARQRAAKLAEILRAHGIDPNS